jgi:hypothetical protein
MQNFWYYRPADDFPPKSVQDVDQYQGAARLNVVCTQTRLSSYAQRKLVTSWCDRMPQLHGVRYLWLNSRVPQRLFDAACAIPALEGLYVKWSGIKSIAALQNASSLKHLHIGSSAQLESIEPLSAMTDLLWLSVENLKKISCLQPLSSLTNLQGLSIEGSMSSTQGVETLRPIGELHQLKYLSISSLRARDRTLAPLYPLQNLEAFHSAQWWSQSELDEIHRRNPCMVV